MKKFLTLILFFILIISASCGSQYDARNPEEYLMDAVNRLHKKDSVEGNYQIQKTYTIDGKDFEETVQVQSQMIKKDYLSKMVKTVETNDPAIKDQLLASQVTVYTQKNKDVKTDFIQVLDRNGEITKIDRGEIKNNGLLPIVENGWNPERLLWDGVFYRNKEISGKEETVTINDVECYENHLVTDIIPDYTVFIGNIDWKTDLVETIVYPFPEFTVENPMEYTVFVDVKEKIPVRVEATYTNLVDKRKDGKTYRVEEQQNFVVDYSNINGVEELTIPKV